MRIDKLGPDCSPQKLDQEYINQQRTNIEQGWHLKENDIVSWYWSIDRIKTISTALNSKRIRSV